MMVRIATLVCGALMLALVHPVAAHAQHHGGPGIGLQKVADGLVAPIQLAAPEDGQGGMGGGGGHRR